MPPRIALVSEILCRARPSCYFRFHGMCGVGKDSS
jgi:hypothetical protein